MNDDCYQRNVLSLKLQLSVLKIVGTHNFDAQNIRQSSGKVNILCGNDVSHPLTEMRF